jgi:hypothetical protein
MPKPSPYVMVNGVKVELASDLDRYSSAHGYLTVGGVSIMDGPEEDAEKLGSVHVVPNGTVEITVRGPSGTRSRSWSISAAELWSLGLAADQQWLLGEGEGR